ncbi:MAG: ACT domain-containing protein [Verrucomicrobiota bacterium]
MKLSLIVSVVGPDRPGLVQELSAVVTEAGGNWEGSRLMQLAGQFAGMVQVVLPKDNLTELETKLSSLQEKGLTVSVIHASDETSGSEEAGKTIQLEVVGQDRSGIVAAISESLANLGVNVIELATDCKPAAWSGETHFFTEATVLLPPSLDEEDLRKQIESIADDLMVEFPK